MVAYMVFQERRKERWTIYLEPAQADAIRDLAQQTGARVAVVLRGVLWLGLEALRSAKEREGGG